MKLIQNSRFPRVSKVHPHGLRQGRKRHKKAAMLVCCVRSAGAALLQQFLHSTQSTHPVSGHTGKGEGGFNCWFSNPFQSVLHTWL